MRTPSYLAALAVLCLPVLGPRCAHAAGFSVNPIHLEISPSKNATSLTVTNENPDDLFMQVRVYRWEHKDGRDVLTDAQGDAPLITPPLFRLGPGGGSQVIRIGFQKPATAPTEERQWRVVVEEVPKARNVSTPGDASAPAGANAASEAGSPPLSIAVHVRVSLPFFQRVANTHHELKWSLERSGPASVRLTAQNLGNVTERLDELHLGSADDAGAGIAGPVYIFPGERRTFDLHPNSVLPPGTVRLSLQGTPHPLISELALSAQ